MTKSVPAGIASAGGFCKITAESLKREVDLIHILRGIKRKQGTVNHGPLSH